MKFRKGQRVKCINMQYDKNTTCLNPDSMNRPEVGKIYTIRDIFGDRVLLNEIRNQGTPEVTFSKYRFEHIPMNPETPEAKTLDDLLKKVTFFGYVPSHSEVNLIQSLLLELKAYREGGVTEEILRRNDGYIKVGRGCVIALDVIPLPVSVESPTIKT